MQQRAGQNEHSQPERRAQQLARCSALGLEPLLLAVGSDFSSVHELEIRLPLSASVRTTAPLRVLLCMQP